MPGAGRNKVAYDDIGYDGITQVIDGTSIVYGGPPVGTAVRGSLQVGLAAAWSPTTDDVVRLSQDGDPLVGRIQEVFDDSFCTVAYKGFVQLLAGQGASITRGHTAVGALGPASAQGYVRQTAVATLAEQSLGRGRIWTVPDAGGLVWLEFE